MDFNPRLLRTSIAHMWCRTPQPGLSVPVPGRCYLNVSWLAIWTRKCAKGWHMSGWIAVTPQFHTVERNIGGKKANACKIWNLICLSWAFFVMFNLTFNLSLYNMLLWHHDVGNTEGLERIHSSNFWWQGGRNKSDMGTLGKAWRHAGPNSDKVPFCNCGHGVNLVSSISWRPHTSQTALRYMNPYAFLTDTKCSICMRCRKLWEIVDSWWSPGDEWHRTNNLIQAQITHLLGEDSLV